MRLDPAALAPIRDPHLTGDLRSWTDVELPGLGRSAQIYAWLPPGHDESDQRYPVLYLHDGDNLFLPERAFGGVAWDVDRAMTRLAADGVPAIVIGVPCHPTLRHEEYSPHPRAGVGPGRAADYAAFLVDHLKPAVDAALRTRPGREDTVTAGSSLGGVVSAYLWQEYQEVFGGAGLFSTAFWWPGDDRMVDSLGADLAAGRLSGRVYVDVGAHEDHLDPEHERLYVEHAERLVADLRRADVPVQFVLDSQGWHFEDAWARRFPGAAEWLLRGHAVAPPAHVLADRS